MDVFVAESVVVQSVKTSGNFKPATLIEPVELFVLHCGE